VWSTTRIAKLAYPYWQRVEYDISWPPSGGGNMAVVWAVVAREVAKVMVGMAAREHSLLPGMVPDRAG